MLAIPTSYKTSSGVFSFGILSVDEIQSSFI